MMTAMSDISIGKYRGLQQIGNDDGTFCILAIDHRQNLRKENASFKIPSNLSSFKIDVISSLSRVASGVLVDPEFGAAQAIACSAIPGDKGLVVALEATGYVGGVKARKGRLIAGWGVEKVKRMGASAAKLLVYYHPKAKTAAETESWINIVAEECRKFDLALMLEVLTYSPSYRDPLPEERPETVIESVRRLSRIGADLLKVQFPLDPGYENTQRGLEACKEITAVSAIPWILLSSGVSFNSYISQVVTACEAGASGVAVGRAVWKEGIQMERDERVRFLDTISQSRLAYLNLLVKKIAKPFSSILRTSASLDWYMEY